MHRARQVIEDIQKYGRARYGTMGLEIYREDRILQDPRARAFIAEEVGSSAEPPAIGVVVRRLSQAGPAAKADMRPYDVITKLDGQEIKSTVDFSRIMLDKRPGDKVTVNYWSRGASKSITLTLADSQ
jgi:serine protease Do